MEIIKDDLKMILMEILKFRINFFNMYMCICIKEVWNFRVMKR